MRDVVPPSYRLLIKNSPDIAARGASLISRVRRARRAAAEAAVAALGTRSSPGSPIRPGRSASPVQPEAAVAAEAAVAVALPRRCRSYRSGSPAASASGRTNARRRCARRDRRATSRLRNSGISARHRSVAKSARLAYRPLIAPNAKTIASMTAVK
jgi:hypothetical protein